jgi:hypothetical protein
MKSHHDGVTSIKEGQLVGEIPGRLNDYENQSQFNGPNSEAYFP